MAAAVTEWTQPLFDHGSRDFRIFFEPFGDVALEGIEFAETLPFPRALSRCIQVFADCLPTHLQMALDFADGPVLGPVEPVQVIDLIGGEHDAYSVIRQTRPES
jgi:hypothetical protein